MMRSQIGRGNGGGPSRGGGRGNGNGRGNGSSGDCNGGAQLASLQQRKELMKSQLADLQSKSPHEQHDMLQNKKAVKLPATRKVACDRCHHYKGDDAFKVRSGKNYHYVHQCPTDHTRFELDEAGQEVHPVIICPAFESGNIADCPSGRLDWHKAIKLQMDMDELEEKEEALKRAAEEKALRQQGTKFKNPPLSQQLAK